MNIPREVHASVALAHENRYQGTMAIASCERLRDAVVATGSEPLRIDVAVDARSGWPRFHGRVQGAVALECRRCGRVYGLPLDLNVNLRLVRDETQARALQAEVEPYCVEDDRLPVRELIEEEVLLALPMLPRCEACENEVAAAEPPEVPARTAAPENPFAVLKRKLTKN